MAVIYKVLLNTKTIATDCHAVGVMQILLVWDNVAHITEGSLYCQLYPLNFDEESINSITYAFVHRIQVDIFFKRSFN